MKDSLRRRPPTDPSETAAALERAVSFLEHSRARNTLVGLTWRDAEFALSSHADCLRLKAEKGVSA